jgi:uncharacterized RDD family membrane protein YckC
VRFAGFWVRFAAAFLDTLVVLALTVPFLVTEFQFLSVASLIVGFLYESYFISSINQATLGKRFFKLRVIDLDNSKITFPKSCCRYFGKFLSSFIFLGGFLMIAVSKKKQGLHDMLFNTSVIYVNHLGPLYELPEDRSTSSVPNRNEKGWVLAGFDAAGYVVRLRFGFGDDRLYQTTGFTVGRDETERDFVIPDPSVSRLHARFIAVANQLFIEDAGSKNGTFVDGNRIMPGSKRKIAEDQEIRFGEVVFSIGREYHDSGKTSRQ